MKKMFSSDPADPADGAPTSAYTVLYRHPGGALFARQVRATSLPEAVQVVADHGLTPVAAAMKSEVGMPLRPVTPARYGVDVGATVKELP